MIQDFGRHPPDHDIFIGVGELHDIGKALVKAFFPVKIHQVFQGNVKYPGNFSRIMADLVARGAQGVIYRAYLDTK